MAEQKDTFGINVMKYCREHEKYVEEQLFDGTDVEELLAWHLEKIKWLQHERHIHLLVTMLTVGVFLFLVGLECWLQNAIVLVFLAVTFCMMAAYLFHYFRLENTVQHWYKIADNLHEAAFQRK